MISFYGVSVAWPALSSRVSSWGPTPRYYILVPNSRTVSPCCLRMHRSPPTSRSSLVSSRCTLSCTVRVATLGVILMIRRCALTAMRSYVVYLRRPCLLYYCRCAVSALSGGFVLFGCTFYHRDDPRVAPPMYSTRTPPRPRPFWLQVALPTVLVQFHRR